MSESLPNLRCPPELWFSSYLLLSLLHRLSSPSSRRKSSSSDSSALRSSPSTTIAPPSNAIAPTMTVKLSRRTSILARRATETPFAAPLAGPSPQRHTLLLDFSIVIFFDLHYGASSIRTLSSSTEPCSPSSLSLSLLFSFFLSLSSVLLSPKFNPSPPLPHRA